MKSRLRSRVAFALIALAAPIAAQAQVSYTFTTLAGTAGAVVKSIDATGTAAQFDTPRGITVDSAGNLYVADSTNHTIRKITAAGVVTTLAGTAGSSGPTDGTGSAARFNEPWGIAVDSTGTVWVADSNSSALRKITAAGVVTTFAGGGGSGTADGTGTAAKFHEPHGVAIDSAGNLYIADYENSVVRKVTSAGVVTTLAGAVDTQGNTDGTGTAARFRALQGIAVDSTGNVFVSDGGNRSVRKITSAGVVTTFAGSSTGEGGMNDGTGTAARFGQPRGLAIDSANNLYVADYGVHLIRKITPAGVVTTLAGTAASPGSTDGTGTAAKFNSPSGITVDSAGNLYVADMENDTIRKITPAGVVTTFAGLAGRSSSADGTGAAAKFEDPFAVDVDSAGNTYIADSGAHCIRKITPAGVVTTLAGLAGTFGSTDGTGTAARFYTPLGVAVDSAGNVYVTDSGNGCVRKITSAGVVTTFATGFIEPHGIAVDTSGNVYVADAAGNSVRKITSAGVATTLAGSGSPGSADGTGTAASFAVPYGLTVDSAGNVYVCDHGNHSIRKITAAGVVTTLAGTSGTMGSTDATGTAAKFKFPSDVAVDSEGNVFVADTDNQVIRKITSAGVVTTIAGSSGVGSTDGVGTAAKFYNPKGIAIDSSGNLYIADRSNHTVRKGTATTATAVAISTQPTTQTVVNGASVTLSVVASGSPAPSTYQWYKDGVAISGATSSSYTIATASSTSAGSYTVVVGNGSTSATSSAAVLTVSTASRLSNLSILTTLSTGSSLTVGFTMTGGDRNVLIRAGGPSLGALGVPGTMVDPRLTLYNASSVQTASNDNWVSSEIATTATSVGAFAFTSGSRDAALLQPLNGSSTAVVAGTAGGTVIVEAYDIGSGMSPRLTNISALNFVGTGSNILIAGVTVAGTGTKNILIRAVGPTLTTLGVPGALSDPKLELYSGSTLLQSNDNWAASLSTTFTSVGAFALTAGSKDAAFVATVTAGASYTVQVSGVGGLTGNAIVELYELP